MTRSSYRDKAEDMFVHCTPVNAHATTEMKFVSFFYQKLPDHLKSFTYINCILMKIELLLGLAKIKLSPQNTDNTLNILLLRGQIFLALNN